MWSIFLDLLLSFLYIQPIPEQLTLYAMKFIPREPMCKTMPQNTTRRRFLLQFLTVVGAIAVPILGFCQTPGMERRQDRRDDRTDRMQQRDDKMEERRDDPVGIRGPERREDRHDLREDRRDDRRERIY